MIASHLHVEDAREELLIGNRTVGLFIRETLSQLTLTVSIKFRILDSRKLLWKPLSPGQRRERGKEPRFKLMLRKHDPDPVIWLCRPGTLQQMGT